jgi:hypothetical protein
LVEIAALWWSFVADADTRIRKMRMDNDVLGCTAGKLGEETSILSSS